MPESSATASSPVDAASARALRSAFSSKVVPVSSTPGVVADDLDVGAEDVLDLLDLVGVAGGQQDPHHRAAGGSLTISCWRAMISLMPASARPRSVSSSARE